MTKSLERIEGVYRTAEPVANTADGTPCYILLRFYEDGLVLQTSLCKDVEGGWHEISEWFKRENNVAGVGRGYYQLECGQLRFTTIETDEETGCTFEVDQSGEYQPNRIQLKTNLRVGSTGADHTFVPLRAARRVGKWPWLLFSWLKQKNS
jgi:hypothetical protein